MFQTSRTSEPVGRKGDAGENKGTTNRKRGVFKRAQRDIKGRWFPQRSKSTSSPQARDERRQSLCHWSSSSNTRNHKQDEPRQEHPESADFGLQSSTSSTDASMAASTSSTRGRPLTRDRYYASAVASPHHHGHSSPSSDTSQGSASSEEVPVEGGVALTEEAVETQIPDIITQA